MPHQRLFEIVLFVLAFIFIMAILFVSNYTPLYIIGFIILLICGLVYLKYPHYVIHVLTISLFTNISILTTSVGLPINRLLVGIALMSFMLILVFYPNSFFKKKSDVLRNIAPLFLFLLVYFIIGILKADLNDLFTIAITFLVPYVFHIVYIFLLPDSDAIETTLKIISLSGVVSVIIELFQTNLLSGRFGGLFINPNAYGTVLNLAVLSSFIFLKRGRNLLFLGQFLLLFVGVILTLSRGALIVFLCICLLFITDLLRTIKRSSFFIKFMSVGVIGGGIYFILTEILTHISLDRLWFSSYSGLIEYSNGRIPALVSSLNMFLAHPISGVGLENSLQYSIDYSLSSMPLSISLKAHNLFAYILAETGFIPFMFLLIALIKYGRRISNLKEKTIENKIFKSFLIIFTVNGFFSHNILLFDYVLAYFGLMVNYICISQYNNDNLIDGLKDN